MKKYLVVTCKEEDGKRDWIDRIFPDKETFLDFCKASDYIIQGEHVGMHSRQELQNEPKIKGFCGPMWGGLEDGVPVIRYENWNAYEILSR